MDNCYFFDDAMGLLRFKGAPNSGFSDRFSSVVAMAADDQLPTKCGVLINVSAVEHAPSFDELGKLRSLVELLFLRFGGRVAIVNSNVGHSTTSMLAAAMTQSENCRAFVIEEEAVDWLTAGPKTATVDTDL